MNERSELSTEFSVGSFSVGDRVLVPGKVTAGLADGVNVELPSGEVVHLCVNDVRPDTDVRVESRQVTTTRVESPWKAEQT